MDEGVTLLGQHKVHGSDGPAIQAFPHQLWFGTSIALFVPHGCSIRRHLAAGRF